MAGGKSTHRDTIASRPTSQHTSTDSTRPDITTNGTPKHRTEYVEDQVLTVLPVVPGTHRVSDGEPYRLTQPASKPSSGSLVDHARIWAGDGDLAAAVGYVRSHLPAGMFVNPHGPPTSSGGDVSSESIAVNMDARWQQPAVYDDILVLYSFTQTGPTVAIRADVQADWLAQRTADQAIPLTVTGVDITFQTVNSLSARLNPPGHVAKDEAVARRLAAALDALTVTSVGIDRCEVLRLANRATFVFHSASGDLRVNYGPAKCPYITIGHGPTLQTDPAFRSAFQQATAGK